MTLLYTYSFSFDDVLINSFIFFHMSLKIKSCEKLKEQGIVSVFLFLKSSLETWFFNLAFNNNPSGSEVSLIDYKPQIITRFFSPIEQL